MSNVTTYSRTNLTVGVATNVLSKTIVALTMLVQQIIHGRELNVNSLSENLKVWERGLATFLALKLLASIRVEVIDQHGALTERFEVKISYAPVPASGVLKSDNVNEEIVKQAVDGLPPLPPNCTCRVVAIFPSGAEVPPVHGWSEAELLPDHHLATHRDFGNAFDFDILKGALSYFSR